MRLYGVCIVNFNIQSEEIIRETAKCYYVEGWMSTYGYKKRILKNDYMVAFTLEDAYAKFEANQIERIRRLKENITYIEEGIEKASEALKKELDNALH